MCNLERYGKIIEAEIIEERLSATELISLSRAEKNALESNRIGWLILLGGVGIALALGAILLLLMALKPNGKNPACIQDCSSISIF